MTTSASNPNASLNDLFYFYRNNINIEYRRLTQILSGKLSNTCKVRKVAEIRPVWTPYSPISQIFSEISSVSVIVEHSSSDEDVPIKRHFLDLEMNRTRGTIRSLPLWLINSVELQYNKISNELHMS